MTISVHLIIIASIIFSLLVCLFAFSLFVIAILGYFFYNTIDRANRLAEEVDKFDSEKIRLDNMDQINAAILQFTTHLRSLLDLEPFVDSPELVDLYQRAEGTLNMIYDYSNIHSLGPDDDG